MYQNSASVTNATRKKMNLLVEGSESTGKNTNGDYETCKIYCFLFKIFVETRALKIEAKKGLRLKSCCWREGGTLDTYSLHFTDMKAISSVLSYTLSYMKEWLFLGKHP